jgi:hypothetical protein
MANRLARSSPDMAGGVMAERYEPPSEFLQMILEEIVPLSGSAYADENRRRLIAMTRDPDRANRDWATLLLAQSEVDDAEVREALLRAAEDEDADVRAEAIIALARLEPNLALPFLQRELKGDAVGRLVFEAATLVADPSLVMDLRDFAGPSEDSWVDDEAQRALAACEEAARN